MELLEPEADDAESRNLYYAPFRCLAQIGSHNQTWPLDLWQTFVSGALGAPIPILVNHPRMLCAYRKHNLGVMPDHAQCCQSMAASTQVHGWALTQLKPFFRSLDHDVRVRLP